MSVKLRQELERRIAQAAIRQLLAAGFTLGVNDGEETTIHHSTDADAIEKAMFTTDEDVLLVYKADDDPAAEDYLLPNYWVKFVYGNDGYDVISDYTSALDQHLSEANRLADQYA